MMIKIAPNITISYDNVGNIVISQKNNDWGTSSVGTIKIDNRNASILAESIIEISKRSRYDNW